jgi:hypothetical protein
MTKKSGFGKKGFLTHFLFFRSVSRISIFFFFFFRFVSESDKLNEIANAVTPKINGGFQFEDDSEFPPVIQSVE